MENPYALGSSAAEQPPRHPDNSAVTRSLSALIQTRPWVRFMGILTAIGAALTGLGSLFMMAAMAFSNPGVAFMLMGLYMLIAVMYGFAAKFLLGYASAISQAENTRDLDDIADALEQQKSFWKLIGLCTAIFLVLYLVFIGVMILAGIASRAV